MNSFTISSFFIVLSNLTMALFLFFGGKSKRVNLMWGVFCLVVSIWGLGAFNASIAVDIESAFFWWQIANISSLLTPAVFCDFVLTYLKKRKRTLILTVYCTAFCILLVNFFARHLYIGELSFMFNQFYYIDWTNSHTIIYLIFYILFYWALLIYTFCLLLQHFFRSKGIERNQLKYFILGMMIGFVGAHLLWLPAFGVDVYPHSNVLIAIYPLIIGYAIVKYHLMEIEIAITRVGIFVLVYSFILGFPIGLKVWAKELLAQSFGNLGEWIPMLTILVFATVGPFIYLFIQRKAEDKLLQEQRSYQSTLRRASLGMGQIKELKELLNLIVYLVSKTVKIEFCEIYLFHECSHKFVLKASKGRKYSKNNLNGIDYDEEMIKFLINRKEPLVYEEISQNVKNEHDSRYSDIENLMHKLEAEIVVPSFIEQRLIALISLGKKKSNKHYTQDDLIVFSILANQAALAIENAKFYEEMKMTHEQLFKAEKMATIGTMADGLSHQINNRLHAMGFIAGDALDTVKLKKKGKLSKSAREFADEMEYALGRIQDNVKRGGKVVEGLLKYTRKGEEGFSAVDLEKLISDSFEMAQFKIRVGSLDIVRDFHHGSFQIHGNFTQLQEVFFNMIDNAYDAMMQRKSELKEEGFKATITISSEVRIDKMHIVIKDNGIGVKEGDLKKLFTPFFTTKLSSKKGTGLGLYVIRQIIEENHGGTVKIESKFKEGSTQTVVLPIALRGRE